MSPPRGARAEWTEGGLLVGTVVEYRELQDRQAVYRLLIYSRAPAEIASAAVSMNRPLAAELIRLPPARRTMRLERCFVKLLEALPDRPVIKDVDVLFHPEYRVDVMRLLVSAYQRRPYSLIWPGTYSEGRLIYAEESCRDYRVYEIKKYDVICVV